MSALILCDVQMPETDGYTVLQHIRKEQFIAETPFVFLSAHDTAEDMRKGLLMGADDYLLKPISSVELVTTVKMRLERLQKFEQKKNTDFIQSMNTMLLHVLPHELRTPLTAIIGGIGLLSEYFGEENEEILDMLKTLSTSSSRLYTLCERFLLYAKLSVFLQNPAERQRVLQSHTDAFGDNIVFFDFQRLASTVPTP